MTTNDPNLLVLGRLLLEDVCSDLVRNIHAHGDPSRFSTVVIDREYPIGCHGEFADIRVEPVGEPPYFVEVKYGYDAPKVLRHIRRKYSAPASWNASKLVVAVTGESGSDLAAIESGIREILPPGVGLEMWGHTRLQQLISDCFSVSVSSLEPSELVALRARIDEGKERRAFGDDLPAAFNERALRQNLLWHFATWRLRELRTRRPAGAADPRHLVPPGVYDHVAVLMADLSGFSRYVRDTPDDAVVRQALTNFYAKARYQVVNAGGMLDKFVGDEIVALFGLPERRPGYLEDAARTAVRLLDIGASVTHDWQRKIDLVQPHSAAHVAIAMGRVQLVTLRALDNAHLGVIGDCLNLAARLLPVAGPGEVVVSNVFRQALAASAFEFADCPPLDAKNLGSVRPWKMVTTSGACQ